LEEIDRRSKLGDGNFKVKNPSAWLTKFFNTIRKGGNTNMNTPQHTSGLMSPQPSKDKFSQHGGYNSNMHSMSAEKYNNSNVHNTHSTMSNASTTHTSNAPHAPMQPRSLEESISGAVKQGMSLPQESI
jgi:hypothetical protein